MPGEGAAGPVGPRARWSARWWARWSDFGDELRRRRAPNHWSTAFGVAAVACVVLLLLTGVLLMVWFEPSSRSVTYQGRYTPMVGTQVSEAYASTLRLSTEVRGGLLLRQAHHWSALLLAACLTLQVLTTFVTGAFRRPRRAQWVLLVAVLLVALAAGWSGYDLPDDMLSGTGLRITEGILVAVPLVGPRLSWMLFGGEFPGRAVEHLYPLHVAVLPVVLVALLALRGRGLWRQPRPQFRGPGRSEQDVVGLPLLPSVAVRTAGLGLVVGGGVLVASATVTVNPVWLYGPAEPANASAGSQPDWYTGFLDGALRLVPPGWEFHLLGQTWSLAVLLPLSAVSAFFLLLIASPWVTERRTDDRRDHHLLDRPRDAPTRTGLAGAAVAFYGTLWAAGSADLVASQFHLAVEDVIAFLQTLLVVGPVLAFLVVRAVCWGLRRQDRELLVHGAETGFLVRLPDGGFAERRRPLDPYQRWPLAAAEAAAEQRRDPAAAGSLPVGVPASTSLPRGVRS